ncbi:hypothetical protein PUBBUKKERS_53 [Escherichia phage vB_EcoD_Pubbukkers]|uniref:Uncharacterized protein n=1 Tax=Escherichia phage vB_EcoD_Pubbukkers TaxID=2894793 RepID=A0AAE8YWF7_9CAUD|nr:hypothetical protein P9614_gp53 [Escherichia phage vB_EcoD_Pubbukkers]UGO50022.1 hypothetical protein PUBBUKKERS_53 [Escherichia phage vB_EcoD_Pubbukkers]
MLSEKFSLQLQQIAINFFMRVIDIGCIRPARVLDWLHIKRRRAFMKALIWNYTSAVAALYEAKALNGNVDRARQFATLAHQSIMCALDDMDASMDDLGPLRKAIHEYALAFSRERLAYRFGIGEKAVTNVARIKAQRELFAQLAK